MLALNHFIVFISESDFFHHHYSVKCLKPLYIQPDLASHISFWCQNRWDELLCLTVCLFYFFTACVGGCHHQWGALHRWQSLYTPFHMCRYIPRRCVEDLQSAGLMLLLFKLTHPNKNTRTWAHTQTHASIQRVFLAALQPKTVCMSKRKSKEEWIIILAY